MALLFGGEGCEHEVSVRGAIDTEAALIKAGVSVFPIFIKKDGGWYSARNKRASVSELSGGRILLEPTFPIRLGKRRGFFCRGRLISVGAVIPLLHGDFGEDGRIQGLLDTAGIPYIGCGTVAGAISQDKAYTKLVAASLGVPTVKGVTVNAHSDESALADAEKLLGYPMFVKPARLGSSVGAGIARCPSELSRLVKDALTLGSGFAMIEEYIEGARELECAFFEINGKQYFTNVGEIRCKSGFYDYDNKYSEDSIADIITDARLDEATRAALVGYSKDITAALGCRDLARLDFFLSREGKLYFNEINTMPGMTDVSMFPRLTEASGYPIGRLLSLLAEGAAGRA